MISVTILTKNSAKHLPEVLSALSSFDEVVILDSGSTDETLLIAKKYPNVTIHTSRTFDGFGMMHNRATALAMNDWILSIDSDEVVSPELAQEIRSLTLDITSVYSISRHNFYNGKWIRWCGWYPDRQYRLYNRKSTSFTEAKVHESIIVQGMRIIPLQGPLIHYSYDTIADFLHKMQVYSDLFAQQNRGQKSSSTCKAVLHGMFTFFKCYFLKLGILGGKEGFIISAYNAHTAFYKYLKLAETQSGWARSQKKKL